MICFRVLFQLIYSILAFKKMIRFNIHTPQYECCFFLIRSLCVIYAEFCPLLYTFFSDRRDTFCYFWLQKGVKWDILEKENASKYGVSKQRSYIKISLHTQCKVSRNMLSQKIYIFNQNLNSRKLNQKNCKKSKTRTILRKWYC